MFRTFLGTIVVFISIAGCATKPVEIADNTPLHPTAVIEKQVINNGLKGFFPSEGTERHYVRNNMRRDESTFKGTGSFSKYLIGSKSDTKISRIDRSLQWQLNTENQEYTECPLKGCLEPSKQPPPSAEQPPTSPHESGCTMAISHTSFTVKPTGQKKSINGFDTEEYQVAWIIILRDNAARNTTSTLNMDIWTTPLTRPLHDVLSMEENYARAFAGAISDSGKQQILPADAAKLISTYLANSLKPGDLNAFLDAGKQMEKIKGYPISTHLAWSIAGNACASKASKDEPSRKDSSPTSPGGLVAGLTGIFAKKSSEETMNKADGEPILSFTVEVKQLKLEQLHDSVFTVPSAYRLVSKK